MFGSRAFGGTYFGQGDTDTRRGAAGGLIGGSGFEPDWLQKMVGAVPKPRSQDEVDFEEMIALGLFH